MWQLATLCDLCIYLAQDAKGLFALLMKQLCRKARARLTSQAFYTTRLELKLDGKFHYSQVSNGNSGVLHEWQLRHN